MRRLFPRALLIALFAAVLIACASGDEASRPEAKMSRACEPESECASDGPPPNLASVVGPAPELATAAGEWPSANRDLAARRLADGMAESSPLPSRTP